MRFKKLRIFVGIAMIMFILIVGSVVVLGQVINSNQNTEDNMVATEPKNAVDYPVVDLNSGIDDAPVENETPVVEPSSQTQPEPTSVVYTPPVVVHRTVTSRAS